jgi:hypothetical protein
VKDLLYAYRVLLTGIHLMRTGEVVANIVVLNELFGLDHVAELVERNRAGTESMSVLDSELAAHAKVLDRLEITLQEEHTRTSLPLEPRTMASLEDLVVRLHLEAGSREHR